MIVCYALGGGLGHVTRTRALLHTLGRDGEPVTVLVSSPQALDPRVLGGWPALLAPPQAAASRQALGDWVARSLARLQPQALYVDAFPGGILGELCALKWPPGLELLHAARRLRWRVYRRRLAGELPVFARTYVLEALEEEHRAALAACSAELEDLAEREIRDPPAAAASALPAEAWLVVHSGPEAEIRELVAYAAELQKQEGVAAPLVLVAPVRPPDLPAEVAHLDVHPAWPLFPSAARIVTACGWNAMRQTAPFQERHHFLPFPRPLDDQFERGARRRSWQSLPRD